MDLFVDRRCGQIDGSVPAVAPIASGPKDALGRTEAHRCPIVDPRAAALKRVLARLDARSAVGILGVARAIPGMTTVDAEGRYE